MTEQEYLMSARLFIREALDAVVNAEGQLDIATVTGQPSEVFTMVDPVGRALIALQCAFAKLRICEVMYGRIGAPEPKGVLRGKSYFERGRGDTDA